MAAKNKYVSTNFNHIYEKTTTTGSSTNRAKIQSTASSSSSSYSAASYSAISSPNKHGRMFVLTRPNTKLVVAPSPPASSIQSKQPQHQQPNHTVQHASNQPQSHLGLDANEISLRPLGRTGTGSSLSSPVLNCEKNVETPSSPLISPKPGKFVPPHLRPGFVPKEEKTGPDVARSRRQGNVGSLDRYGDDAQPKSGEYERTMRRPTSSGSRPGSSG